jgi:anti-sigma28 factor (negative regulator of flagellin synthesis)
MKTGMTVMQGYIRVKMTQQATINLSGTLRRVLTARNLVHPTSGMREEKISVLRDRIEKGTYTIDYETTAARVLRAFMDEQVDSAAGYTVLPLVEALSLS